VTPRDTPPPPPADYPELLAQLSAEGWAPPPGRPLAGGRVLDSPCTRVRLAVRDLAHPAHTTCELHGPGTHGLLVIDFSRRTPLGVIAGAARAAAERTWDTERGEWLYPPAATDPTDSVAKLGFTETRREEDCDFRLLEAVYTHPDYAGSAHYFPDPDGESWWVCGPQDAWQACGGRLATGRVTAAMLTATRNDDPRPLTPTTGKEARA
jgi:hypothetical protein